MAARLAATPASAPCSTPRSSSSSTPRRSCTTTSSTNRTCAAGGSRCIALGQRHHGAARRLPLHQVDVDGADAGHAGRHSAAVRRHAAHDRRRVYQLTKNGDVEITEDEHFDIIRRKTAYLFGGCAQIGGMLGGVTPGAARRALREYGFNFGVAFQLVDDLLDYTGEADRARQADWRRPARRQGHAAASSSCCAAAATRRKADSASSTSGGHDGAVARDLRLLREHRAIELRLRRAVEYADAGEEASRAFPPSREREALMALPDYVLVARPIGPLASD